MGTKIYGHFVDVSNAYASMQLSVVHKGDGIAYVYISSFVCHRAHRRQGHATALIQRVCKWADKCGIVLKLTADPFGTRSQRMPFRRLCEFYNKHGFVGIEGQSDLNRESPWQAMVRQPA